MTSSLGQTKKAWCDEFEVMMKGEFERSAMVRDDFLLSSTEGLNHHGDAKEADYVALPQLRPSTCSAAISCARSSQNSTRVVDPSLLCKIRFPACYSSCWTNGFCLLDYVLLVVIVPICSDSLFLLVAICYDAR
ncbi:hypothetical protein Tco_0991125 [Tanacetum coccineum]|uniref:Uncharacterized protein n=1 Tax=Tanacetum coccineum TaxID=301880 RepID=A0ABQ5EYD5_9ASTR